MKYTHLFFDLDNTVFNFNASSEIALEHVAALLDLPYDQVFKEVYHEHNAEVWHLLELGQIDGITLRKQRFERTAQHFGKQVDGLHLNRIYLQQLVKHPTFMPHSREILEYFSNSHQLIAVTNGLREVQRPRLIEVGLDKLFDAIVVSDEIGVAKPHHDYFDYAWKQVNQPDKSNCLMIGDNPNSDIKGAIHFGFSACLYDPQERLQSDIATYKITDLNELKHIVK